MSLFRRRPPAPAPLVRRVEWPFAGHLFPPELGCVAPGSVIWGERPMMQVGHAPDGSWTVADGVGDPDEAEGLGVASLRRLAKGDRLRSG